MADRVVSYVFRGDISGLKASLTAAGQSVGKLADDLTKADAQSAKFRKGLSATGDTAGKVGLVAAAGLGAIVVATANFDKAMSNVAATGDEARASLDQLREAAIQAGAETAFSASEAAAGIENLLKAGVSAQDVLGGGLSGALDLAAAGELQVADAAEIAATAMTQFKLGGEDVTHIADLLAAGAGKAQGDVSDLSMALKQSGLVASQMGLSIEETTGTLAAFASAGLLGSDAGTSFRTMLLRLANPTKESSDLMAELGINAYDASGQFVGMQSLAGQLATAFEGQTQAQRDAALATLFGSDAIRAASVLYSQGAEGVAEWTASVDDAGYAAETAQARLDNLRGDLEELGGSLETALIGSGEGSQGALRELVQGLTAVVNAYNSLPPAAQGATTAVLGVTAVAGGGLWAFSKAVQGISDTRAALENLGPAGAKASSALKGVGKAAGIAGIALAGFAAADAIQGMGDESLPTLEALTSQLIELANAGAAARLSSEFDSLGDSIARLTDKNWAQQFNDTVSGFLGGILAGNLTEAENEIAALDAALADLASSGHADVAAQAIDNLAKSQGLSEEQVDALLDVLPQYADALTGVENDAALAASGTDDLTDATGDLGAASGDAAAEIDKMVEAMRDQRSEALRAANAEIDYQASLDDARQALKDNGRTLDITTEKGRANRSALNDVAGAWNNLSAEAKDAPGAYAAARKAFIDLAVSMGASRAEARQLAQQLMEIPPRKAVEVTVDTSAARSALESFIATSSGRVISIGTRVVNSSSNRIARASGGPVYGPGTSTSDSIPAWLSNGEFVMNAKAVQRYGLDTMHAMNAMRLAAGGPVGMARGGSIDDRLDVLRLQQQINELRRDLAEDGKDSLKGLARAIAEAELEAAKRDLRQARRAPFAERRADLRDQRAALRSIEFDVEGGASVEETRDALREFRADVREAGGTWTKEMARTAHRLIDLAKATERTERRIEDETKLRDILKERLDKEIAALEDVRSAMQSFSAQVGGNFRSDVFGLGGVVAGGSVSAPVNDPALNAARAALAGAEGRYQAALTSGGDPLQRSYLASKALAEVAQYRDQVDELERSTAATVDAQEQTVSGLDALREALIRDTEQANSFYDSLTAVSGILDPAFFMDMASRGDVGTAAQIAGLDRGSLEELNLLWQEREAAAAQVATFATQQVFGQQLDAATRAVELTERAIARQDRTISTLNNRLEVLDSKVEAGAKRGVQALGPQIERIERAIQGQARQIASIQQGGKRGRN